MDKVGKDGEDIEGEALATITLPRRQSFRLRERDDMRASTTRPTAPPLRPASVRRTA